MNKTGMGLRPGAPPGPKKRKSVEIPLPLSLLLLPFFFLAGVISLPITLVGAIIQKRQEAKFANRMNKADRLLEWQTFEQQLESGHGTAIIEYFSLKGPVRLWWTQEQPSVPENSHRGGLPECLMGQVCDFCAQMRSLYTSPEGGKAKLVALRSGQKGENHKRMESVRKARHITTHGHNSKS
jgi:hypothetical protein